MIDLLDHPYEEVRNYAKAAIVGLTGHGFGYKKERYLELIES